MSTKTRKDLREINGKITIGWELSQSIINGLREFADQSVDEHGRKMTYAEHLEEAIIAYLESYKEEV